MISVVSTVVSPIKLYCDNDGAIVQAKEPRSHQKSKHVLIQFHLLREMVGRRDVEVCKIFTDDNITDPFTKPLSQKKHERHLFEMGIKLIIKQVLM